MAMAEELRTKSYMNNKPSWAGVDGNPKYLIWAYYTGWFFYSGDDPWTSTNFVDYVEDRNGNQVRY